MSKYLIKLKPIGKYFFGGDMTFEVGDKSNKDYNSKYSSYIIVSNKFPQQTSLLGMLRYLLLTKSPEVFSLVKNQITNKSDAANVIGQASFSVMPDHKLDEKQDSRFGKIVSIGPCFLLHEYSKEDGLVEEYFLSAPKDYQLIISFENSLKDGVVQIAFARKFAGQGDVNVADDLFQLLGGDGIAADGFLQRIVCIG